jgi:hypothetical protein
MRSFVKISSLIFVVLALIITCRPSTRKTSDSEQENELLEKSEIEESLKEVAFPLPEPFEVYALLEDIGATYLGEVLNPVNNAENYFSQKDKAINIGVFAADLGYAVTYKHQPDIKVYSKTLKSLVDELGVDIDYTTLQNEESRQALLDKDSLVSYVTDVFYDTYTFLYRENTPALAGLMAAGAWTEGLYIATHISDDTFNNTEIVKIIHEQGKGLEELISLLSNFTEDEKVKNFLEAYKKLDVVYKEAGDSMTEKQLNSITSIIETIRESMIS